LLETIFIFHKRIIW